MLCRPITGFVLSLCLSVAAAQSTSIAQIQSLIRSQSYAEALREIQAELKQKPTDTRLWTLEAIVFSLEKQKPQALAAFEKALRYEPGNLAALRGKAEILYEANDPKAVPILEAILRHDPGDAVAHEMLGVLEAGNEDCPAAITHFAQSAEATAQHPRSLEAYGRCLMETKQPEKAVPVFQQLAALLPGEQYPKYDLAVAMVEAKQYSEALTVLDPMLGQNPPDPEVLSLASDAEEEVGDTAKAVSLLRQAIVASPQTSNYYLAFALLCLDHDSFQVGIDILNAGLKYIPDDPSLYLARGLLYAQLSQYDKAEEDFHRTEQLDSAQSLSSYAMDLAEMARNNPDKALANVREQIKAHPESASLHFVLAKLLWSQNGNSAEAEKAAEQALKLDPDMVRARDLLADIYAHEGKFDLAAEQCRLALRQDPDDASAIYHLIIALRRSKPEGQQEIAALVKQLSDMKRTALQTETAKKRYQLTETPSAPQ
jgi:tetratricopeptide (TPR) repeat protein